MERHNLCAKTVAACFLLLGAVLRPGTARSCATSDSHKDGPHSAELEWESFKKFYNPPQSDTQLGLSDTENVPLQSLDVFDEHGSMFE